MYYVPANDIAMKLGNARTANVVMLGAMVHAAPVVPVHAAASTPPLPTTT